MSFATNKILLLFLCVLFDSLVAQNEFTTFTKDDGLTSTNIIITKVDHRGIIWVATSNGINAFVENEWVAIKSIVDRKGNNKNLGSVYHIYEALNGDLWIVTRNGITIFNGKFWTIFDNQENEGTTVTDIFEDRRGWIWVMFEKSSRLKDVSDLGFSVVEGTIQMYSGQQWYKYPREIGGSAAVTIGDPTEYFTSHIQDVKGNIWVTNLDGLYMFNGKKWIETNDEELPSDMCFDVFEASNKEIWVATQYGVAHKVADEWVVYEKVKGLKGNNAYGLFEDKEDRIWAFTRKDSRFKSLCVFAMGKWKPYDRESLKIKGEVNQLINLDGKLIAFSNKGISVFEEKDWVSLTDKYSVEDDDFNKLTIAKNKTMWFAAQNGLYKLDNNGLEKVYSPAKNWDVTSIYESYGGEMWIGTEKDGIYVISPAENKHFTIDNGLNDNVIKEIFEDKYKNIWVVTKSGISRFNKFN